MRSFCALVLLVIFCFSASTTRADQPSPQPVSLADAKLDFEKLPAKSERQYTLRYHIPDIGITEWGVLTLKHVVEADRVILHELVTPANRPVPQQAGIIEQTLIARRDGLLSPIEWTFVRKLEYAVKTMEYEGRQLPVSVFQTESEIPENLRGKTVVISSTHARFQNKKLHLTGTDSTGKSIPEVELPYHDDSLTPAAFLRITPLLAADPSKKYLVKHIRTSQANDLYHEMSDEDEIGPLQLQYDGPETIRIGEQVHECHRFKLSPISKDSEIKRLIVWKAWIDAQGVLQKFEIVQASGPRTTVIGTLGLNPGPIEGGDGYLKFMKRMENFK